LADAAHQSLKHCKDENKNDADKGNAHEPECTLINVRRDAQQFQKMGRQDVAECAENDRGDRDHDHGLARNMIDHALPSGTHILGCERRARHREPSAECDNKKGHGKTDGHSSDGGGT